MPAVAAALVLAASPAFADVPVGWEDRVDVTGLQWMSLIGLALLFVAVISLAALLPGLIRGEGLLGRDDHDDDQWFGGPRTGVDELGGQPEAIESTRTGGGSGTW